MEIKLDIKPWSTPNYIVVNIPTEQIKQKFGELVKDTAAIPLKEVDVNVLAQLCDAFRQEIFQKAGKKDPEIKS